eukprot:GHUV01000459.1.p1 GENE.GHUV01000459.1~~GHUV01000459.1.p1  ORF type:complete len:298 (+),score=47.01 GHUV01000459.1:273-1166(+)
MSGKPALLMAVLAASLLLLCGAAELSTVAAKATSLRGVGKITAKDDLSGRPWFCRGLDCPDFEVLETKGDLQLRRYRKNDFLVTRVEAGSLLEAQIIATKRLVAYFAGDNEDSVKFRPTVPLNSVLITADRKSETVKGKFYFATYLPDELQGDKAPRPNNREVRVIRIGRRAVWVDTFSSPLITESDIIRRGWRLIKDLEYMGRKVDSRFFVFSLYEVPVPFVPHHYEIAIRAKCRRHGDVPTDSGMNSGVKLVEEGEVPSGNEWDDDYPFPVESGGDIDDDECDDSPDLPDILAAW